MDNLTSSNICENGWLNIKDICECNYGWVNPPQCIPEPTDNLTSWIITRWSIVIVLSLTILAYISIFVKIFKGVSHERRSMLAICSMVTFGLFSRLLSYLIDPFSFNNDISYESFQALQGLTYICLYYAYSIIVMNWGYLLTINGLTFWKKFIIIIDILGSIFVVVFLIMSAVLQVKESYIPFAIMNMIFSLGLTCIFSVIVFNFNHTMKVSGTVARQLNIAGCGACLSLIFTILVASLSSTLLTRKIGLFIVEWIFTACYMGESVFIYLYMLNVINIENNRNLSRSSSKSEIV